MVDKIKKVALGFIKSDQSSVLVIRGDWGIGKTHFWDEWLKEAKSKNEIGKPHYAYVSLFGINSLSELKKEIFYGYASHYTGGLTKCLESLKIPSIGGISLDVNAIGWGSVKNSLICIDDFERHGEGLDPKDIFGIISVLKEQKNCNVVLILNDKELDKNPTDKEAYENYREKVVDIELEFTRDISDLVKVVFTYKDNGYYESIENAVKELNVLNIRTLYKIRDFIKSIEPEIKEFPEALRHRIIRSVVLFTTLHFSKPSAELVEGKTVEFPDLKTVLATSYEVVSMLEYNLSKEDVSDSTKQLHLLRNKYNWNGSDEMDQAIGGFIKKGYLDKDKFHDVYNAYKDKLDAEDLKDEALKLSSDAWDAIWQSYDDNLDDIYDAIEKSIKASLEVFPALSSLNSFVLILKEIDEGDKAEKLIDKYIEIAEGKNADYFDVDYENNRLNDLLDASLKSKMKSKYEEIKEAETNKLLEEVDRCGVLRDIADRYYKNNLTNDDYNLISKLKYDDFHGFLKSTKIDAEVTSFINIFLADSHLNHKFAEGHNPIKKILSQVVKDISDEHNLNKWRMREHMKKIQSGDNDTE